MAILTNPNGHGRLLHAIVQHIGDGSTDPATLLRRFVPGADLEPALMTETLIVGATLGVLETGRKVSVARPSTGADTPETLRTWVMNDDVVASDLFSNSAPGATDLVRGLCWLLAQDPVDGPVSTKNFEERQHGLSKTAVTNAEQYRALARWACWLGIAMLVARKNYRVVPDLRHIVRMSLPAPGSTITIADLEARVGEIVPVAPGGWIRTRYDDGVGTGSGATLAPSISHAIETLRDERVVDVSVAEDAAIGGQVQRLLARSNTPVTDIEVLA